jgi:hypothetical protein
MGEVQPPGLCCCPVESEALYVTPGLKLANKTSPHPDLWDLLVYAVCGCRLVVIFPGFRMVPGPLSSGV